MMDNDVNTYISVSCDEDTVIEFTLDEPTTFNTVKFTEYINTTHGSYIKYYKLEAVLGSNAEYTEIYRQDEMGNRIGVVNQTYTAQKFRLTARASNIGGGIAEISFANDTGYDTANFRNVVYYTASRLPEVVATGYNEVMDATDIILFDYGAWEADGSFTWSTIYTETEMAKNLETLKEAIGEEKYNSLRIWFCLQNYNRATVTDTATLFTTEASRKKLADFSLDLCKKYGFYGVDIDYEFPERGYEDFNDENNAQRAKNWSNFSEFLVLAGDILHAEGYKLSAAMGPFYVQLSNAAVQAIDAVNVMTYGLVDNMGGYGRFCTYQTVQRSIDYFTGKGFDKSKLILGVPFYSMTIPRQKSEKSQEIRWYHLINRNPTLANNADIWNNFFSNDAFDFYFNAPAIMRDKTYAAISQGLGGVFCWCNGCDVEDGNPLSLADAIANTITRFTAE